MSQERVSRRQVLRGAGLAAGAAAGAVVLPAGALAAEPGQDPPGVPTAQPGELVSGGLVAAAAPALNPAWTYLTLSYEAFFVLGTGGALSVGGNGLSAATATSLRAPLALPQGAVLREVTFFVFNSSVGTSLSVGVTVVAPPSATAGGSFAFTQAGANAHTVTITSFPFNPLDPATRSYSLSAFLQSGATHALVGARVAYTPPGLSFVPLPAQARKLDTRLAGPLTGKIETNQTKVLSLAPELPPGVGKVALLNLTITETEGSGFLALFPGGTDNPGTSSINWSSSGLSLANSAVVAVPAGAEVAILCGGGGRTHVVVDLVGYYL